MTEGRALVCGGPAAIGVSTQPDQAEALSHQEKPVWKVTVLGGLDLPFLLHKTQRRMRY